MSLPCSKKASASKKPATYKKRAVTVQNWISEYDKELGTATWLKYENTGTTL
jgi:hypothetical protein